jgi:hypothetical protein
MLLPKGTVASPKIAGILYKNTVSCTMTLLSHGSMNRTISQEVCMTTDSDHVGKALIICSICW